MLNFYKTFNRVLAVIPNHYKKKVFKSFVLSLVLLILDIFSIFLLIPLMVSLLNVDSNTIAFLPSNLDVINKYHFIAIVILFFFAKNFVSIYINKFQSSLAFKLGSEYSLSLSKHYLLSDYLAFKQKKKSSIIKDIIFIPNDFIGNVLLSINTIVTEIILLSLIGLVGIYYNFLIALLIVIVIGCITFIYKKHNQSTLNKINATRVKDYDNNISNLNNLLNGYLSIKSPNIVNHFLKTFHKSNQTLNQSYAVLQSKRINSSKQTEIILVLLLCLIFLAINVFALNGITPAIFLSVFASLIFKSVPSINKLNIAFTNLKSHLYTLDIIEKKTKEFEKMNTKNPSICFNEQIVLKNISFSYENKKPILNNLNIKIDKGLFIGIVGSSGIGKTTLLNIIARLIPSTKGYIYVDNTEITEFNKYEYFNLFSYLTQKPFIYEGSIKDNLLMFNNEYKDEDVIHVINSMKLDKIIDQFPNKLDTYIGSDAGNLSAGQLQRICIARAILNNPKILILDEATNNLDLETEIETLNYLKSFAKKNKTTVISVTHHIEEIKHLYDRIITLKENL